MLAARPKQLGLFSPKALGVAGRTRVGLVVMRLLGLAGATALLAAIIGAASALSF